MFGDHTFLPLIAAVLLILFCAQSSWRLGKGR
jgi:hypothetical protein